LTDFDDRDDENSLQGTTSFEIKLSPVLYEVQGNSIGFVHEHALLDSAQEHSGLFIPVSVFGTRLGVLETVCIYLKDNCKKSWTEIAKTLRKSPKTIFASYSKAKRKHPAPLLVESPLLLPVSELAANSGVLGPLESLTFYLHSLGISCSEIARMVQRNPQTIFTSLRRANAKAGRGERKEKQSKRRSR